MYRHLDNSLNIIRNASVRLNIQKNKVAVRQNGLKLSTKKKDVIFVLIRHIMLPICLSDSIIMVYNNLIRKNFVYILLCIPVNQ